jgi:hypothetical protein
MDRGASMEFNPWNKMLRIKGGIHKGWKGAMIPKWLNASECTYIATIHTSPELQTKNSSAWRFDPMAFDANRV